jgi:hypothetical protein
MKKLKIILMTMILTSCSIKKKIDPNLFSNQLEALKIAVDSDNDGISDELERRMGTNPLIADIPKISVGFVKDISIGAIFNPSVSFLGVDRFSLLRQEFNEIDSSRGGDIELLQVLRKKVVKNQYNHLRNIKAEKIDVITNDDLRTSILSSWTDELYYPYMDILSTMDGSSDNGSGKFIANLKIKISNAINVSEISDISLQSFFYDYEQMSESEIYNHYLLKSSGAKERFKLSGKESYEPVTIYPLIANELKSNDIYSKINERSEIGIKFTNYNYTNLGIPLNYNEVLSKVFDGDAKIIYSDGMKTEVFFVSPDLTIEKALSMLGKKIITNKDGDIYSINGIESTAKYPLDIDRVTIDDVKKGIWSVYGDSDNLSDLMKPQGLYIISYATIGEILSASKKWITLDQKALVQSIILENVFNGDEVLFDIDEIKVSTLTESHRQTEVWSHRTCGSRGCGPDSAENSFCTKIRSTPTEIESNVTIASREVSKWFTFENEFGEKVNAKVFKYGSIIKIIFDSLNSYLKNTIKISFQNPDFLNSSARTGQVGGTCKREDIPTSKTFINKFKITGVIKMFGINKY